MKFVMITEHEIIQETCKYRYQFFFIITVYHNYYRFTHATDISLNQTLFKTFPILSKHGLL